MGEWLRSMEGKLHNVDNMQEKVFALEASNGELGAQQDTLSSTVESIDLAQTQLTAIAGYGDTRSVAWPTTSRRLPSARRGR
jgi:hypothetical protein